MGKAQENYWTLVGGLMNMFNKSFELLEEFAGESPCIYNHKGICITHLWLDEGECLKGRAQRLLKFVRTYDHKNPGCSSSFHSWIKEVQNFKVCPECKINLIEVNHGINE